MPRRHKDKNLPDHVPRDNRGMSSAAWNDDKSDSSNVFEQPVQETQTVDLADYAAPDIPDMHSVRYGHVGHSAGDGIDSAGGSRRRSRLSKEEQDELLKSVLPSKIGTDPTKRKTRRRRGDHVVAHRYSGHTEVRSTQDTPITVPTSYEAATPVTIVPDTFPSYEQIEVRREEPKIHEPVVHPPASSLAPTPTTTTPISTPVPTPTPPPVQAPPPTAAPIPVPEPEVVNENLSLGAELKASMNQSPVNDTDKKNIFEMAPEKLVDADFMHEDSEKKPLLPKFDLEKIKSSKVARIVWNNKLAFSIAAGLFLISAFFLFKPATEPPKTIPIPEQQTSSGEQQLNVEPQENDVTVTLPPESGGTQFDQDGNVVGSGELNPDFSD